MKKRCLPLDLLLLFVDILMIKFSIAQAFDYYMDDMEARPLMSSINSDALPNEASAASNLKNNVLVNDAIQKVVRILSTIQDDEQQQQPQQQQPQQQHHRQHEEQHQPQHQHHRQQDPYVPKNGQPEDPFSTKYERKPLVELGEIENLNKKYFADFQLGQDPEKMMPHEEDSSYFPDRPVQREENFYQIDELYKLNTPRVLRKAGHDHRDNDHHDYDDNVKHQKAIVNEVKTTRKPVAELKQDVPIEDEIKDIIDHSKNDHIKDVDSVDDHNKDDGVDDHSKEEEYHDDDPFSIKKAMADHDPYLNKDIPVNDPFNMEKDMVHDQHTTHHPNDQHMPNIYNTQGGGDYYDSAYKNYFKDNPFKEIIKSTNPDPHKYPPRKMAVNFGYSFLDDKNKKLEENNNNNNNDDGSHQPKKDELHNQHIEKPHNVHYSKISENEDEGSDDKVEVPEKKKMKKVAASPKEDDSDSEDYETYQPSPKKKQSNNKQKTEANDQLMQLKEAVKILASIQNENDRKIKAQRGASEPKQHNDDYHSETDKRKRKPMKKFVLKSRIEDEIDYIDPEPKEKKREQSRSEDESDDSDPKPKEKKREQRSKKRSRKVKDDESESEDTTIPPPHKDEEYSYHGEAPKNDKIKRKTFRKVFYIDSSPQTDSSLPTQPRKKKNKKEKEEKGEKHDREPRLTQSDEEYDFHGDEVDKAEKKNRKEPTGKMYLNIDYEFGDDKNNDNNNNNKKDSGLQDDDASGGDRNNNKDSKSKTVKRVRPTAHARAKFVTTGRISQKFEIERE